MVKQDDQIELIRSTFILRGICRNEVQSDVLLIGSLSEPSKRDGRHIDDRDSPVSVGEPQGVASKSPGEVKCATGIRERPVHEALVGRKKEWIGLREGRETLFVLSVPERAAV